MKHRRRNKMFIRFILLIALLVSFSVGYAYLNKTLSIEGTTTVAKTTWNVRFSNIQVIENNAIVESAPTLADNATKVNFTINLDKPGDSYAFTVDVVNSGTLDAKLGSISISGLSGKTYLEHSVTYLDGLALQAGDELKAGSKETIKVVIKFKKDITANELESDLTILNLVVSGTYSQSDGTETPVNHPVVCRKATTLHQTTCQRNDTNGCMNSTTGYTTGSTITYGHTDSNKLVNGELTSGVSTGYALDCDLTGQGTNYNERFYYVSDTMYYDNGVKYDSNYATLIYYSNVLNKVATPNSTLAYYTSDENWHGPSTTFMSNMPLSTDWINTLRRDGSGNSFRQIVDETGATSGNGNTYANYDYTSYGGRLLTYHEAIIGCGSTSNLHTKCEFLMENTRYENSVGLPYGYWLETPKASSNSAILSVYGGSLKVYPDGVRTSTNRGLRPAIEVPKANISLD